MYFSCSVCAEAVVIKPKPQALKIKCFKMSQHMIYMYKSLQYCDVRSSASLWCGIPTINTFLLTEPKSENVNNISACFQKQ